MPELWRKEQKYAELNRVESSSGVQWTRLKPDEKNTWLTEGQRDEFVSFLPLGDKETKGSNTARSLFRSFSLGVATNRDEWVYSYNPETIRANVRKTFEAFDKERSRYTKMSLGDRKDYKPDVREAEVKWTDRLIEADARGHAGV